MKGNIILKVRESHVDSKEKEVGIWEKGRKKKTILKQKQNRESS